MKYVIIAGVIILAIFLIILQFIPIGIEPLTEVYIENHTKIPNNIFPARSYNFTFTVHNLEYQDMNYQYVINEIFQNSTYSLNSGTIYLADNESKSIYQEYSAPKGFGRMKVEVIVTKPNNESIDIHFWNNEIVGTTIIIGNDGT